MTMPAMPDDKWVAANSPIDAERLHALGAVIVYWTECERELFQLFGEVLGLPLAVPWSKTMGNLKELWVIAHDLGNVAMPTEALAGAKNFPSEIQSAIKNALAVYETCRQNRNQLVHFWTSGNQLFRKSKGPDWRVPQRLKSDLADIRRVAEDMKALSHHMSRLRGAFSGRLVRAPRYLRASSASNPSALNSLLPTELALPALLYSPPPQAPTPKRYTAKKGRRNGKR